MNILDERHARIMGTSKFCQMLIIEISYIVRLRRSNEWELWLKEEKKMEDYL